MKNLRKVLAMVLAFACTFTMFASAKLYEDVQPGTEFSEAITMLSDLGIIQGKTDNKYHPEDTITRAEACALIARLMTGDPNAAGFNGAHHFKDVPAGHWASSAIGYAVVNGIAVGVDQAGTKFEPNRPIKDKEFVTMIVRALGYETPDMRNNFPFGYMSAANAIGLLQDVNLVPDTDALRGEDAQVIYNAMFVDYARGAKRVNVAHGTNVETYPTLAESVWHLDRAAVGTWDKHDKDDENVTLSNCKAHTWVIVGQDGDDNILAYPIEDGNTEKDSHEIYESLEKDENGVKAAAYKFKYEGTGDIDALRGYKVELWGAGKHGAPSWDKKEGKYVFSNDWKIKAIKTIAGQTKFDYDASKADSKRDDGEIKVDEETTLKLGTAADNAKKVSEKNTSKTDRTTYLSKEEYNREKATSDKKVEAALNVRDGAQYRLMDWDGDKEIDWVVVSEANYYKVESVSSKRLTVTSMVDTTKNKKNEEEETESLTQTWKLDDDNEIFTDKDKKNSYKVKYEVPEGLKEGDIIEVAYSTGWDKITGTVSVVESENHKLEKVATKNHLTLTFDGQVTELAENRNEADTIVPENPSKYIDFDEEELGREFAIAKNRNGFIIHSDYATDSTNYLMVLDTDNGENKVRGELGAMKIITADNKVETNVEVVSDLRIDDKTSGNGYDKDSRHFDEDKIVGNVYKYWKDADGRITKMQSVVNNKQEAKYEYVAKNDRLTVGNGESYALEDAKVIFAVKPHGLTQSYIQHTGTDLKVDDADVLAVKQADIPDIGDKEDTNIAELDRAAATDKSWIKNTRDHNITIAFDTNNNKDIKGAVLGVNSFNKFNAGSTKIGLVSNVSFDSNGVVSLDVATNGKTDTLSSAEKVKFEDIVSVKDYKNDTTQSVASRTETINVGLMKNKSLKDYLYKNGAYAEITTDKDGKLTGVLFMDEKDEHDGSDVHLNAGNAVVGNYYQVSRKVIADVKENSWLSVIKGSAIYTDEDTFVGMDPKNVQKASDFASDAAYYVIDGKPTRNDKEYTNHKASILDGFDGTPDIKAGTAADVVASEINVNTLNDRYNVADVATKIDNEGAGDVVAVYAYSDDMDESEQANIASVTVTDDKNSTLKTVKPGQTVNITAEVVYVEKGTAESLNAINVYDKDHKLVETVNAKTGSGSKKITTTWNVPKQNVSSQYTFEAVYGATKFAGTTTVDVNTADTKFEASLIQLVDWNSGNPQPSTPENSMKLVGKNSFAVKVSGETAAVTRAAIEGVVGLKPENFKITVNGIPQTIDAAKFVEHGNGYYLITVKDVDFTNPAGQKLAVGLQNVNVATGMQDLTVTAADGQVAQGGKPVAGGQTDGTVTGAGNVAVATFTPVENTTTDVNEVKVKLTSADGKAVTGVQSDISATVGQTKATSITEGSGNEVGIYTLNFASTDLRGKTVKIVVGNVTNSYFVPTAQLSVQLATPTLTATQGSNFTTSNESVVNINNKVNSTPAAKIWLENQKFAVGKDSVDNKGLTATLTTTGDVTKVTVTGTPTEVGEVKFVVGVGDAANEKAILTVDVKSAPSVTDTVASGKTPGVKKVDEVKAASTYTVAYVSDKAFKVTVTGADGFSEEVDVTATNNANDTAAAIKTALEGNAQVNAKYTPSNTGEDVKLEAKAGVDAETIELRIGSTDAATITLKGEKTTGVKGIAAVKGEVKFKIAGTATDEEAGTWTVTVGTKTVDVEITAGQDAATIANAIKAKFDSDQDLEATVDADTVTIKERNNKEGTICNGADFAATFTKKSK